MKSTDTIELPQTQADPDWFSKNPLVISKPEHSFVIKMLLIIKLAQRDQLVVPKKSRKKFKNNSPDDEKARAQYKAAMLQLDDMKRDKENSDDYRGAVELNRQFFINLNEYYLYLEPQD